MSQYLEEAGVATQKIITEYPDYSHPQLTKLVCADNVAFVVLLDGCIY
jgi:hypothetical protein